MPPSGRGPTIAVESVLLTGRKGHKLPLVWREHHEGVVTVARQVIKVLDTNYLGDSLTLRALIKSDVAETAG